MVRVESGIKSLSSVSEVTTPREDGSESEDEREQEKREKAEQEREKEERDREEREKQQFIKDSTAGVRFKKHGKVHAHVFKCVQK